LAEASPDAFLSAIEDSLDQNDPPILSLFGHDEGGVFGAEHLSDLMWAMESLAWSPAFLPRVTLVLACLDAIDTKPRRYRAWAKAISFEYPHTAKALDGLADGYDWYAQREDEDAERLDWGT